MKQENQKNRKEMICKSLKEGLTKKDAAIMAGIDESTLYRWLNDDASFASQTEENLLEYKRSLIQSVNHSALKDGKFALKILERRWWNEWGLTKRDNESGRNNLEEVAEYLQNIYKEIHRIESLEDVTYLE